MIRQVRALLFDMDGVLYHSDTPIPGAAEALAWVRTCAIPHLFVTNTTSRPRAALRDKLAAFGIPAELDQILTPPVAAAAWLRAQADLRVALFVPEATQGEFAGLRLVPSDAAARADAVVIGDLGAAWDFDTLNRAFLLLQENPAAQLIALGGTKFWQGPKGLQLDVAPFTAALECATGREALVFGKPSREFYEAAVTRLVVAAGETLMIGDDIEVDVAGAQRAGLKAALVQTGKFRPEQLERGVVPDFLLASVAELTKLF
jgi:phospholysine phosphohistidine inorganic pyrophosphate phosphatase